MTDEKTTQPPETPGPRVRAFLEDVLNGGASSTISGAAAGALIASTLTLAVPFAGPLVGAALGAILAGIIARQKKKGEAAEQEQPSKGEAVER